MLDQILTVSFLTAFLSAAIRMAVPLAYAGLGETISEKSGILNIGMEGVMLSGAFFSFAGTFFSGSILVGLLCAVAGGSGCQHDPWDPVHQAIQGPVGQRNCHQYFCPWGYQLFI